MKTTVSNRLRELRIQTGLTQVHLAKIVGVSERTIIRWEQGTGEPRLSQLKTICKALNVTTQAFM